MSMQLLSSGHGAIFFPLCVYVCVCVSVSVSVSVSVCVRACVSKWKRECQTNGKHYKRKSQAQWKEKYRTGRGPFRQSSHCHPDKRKRERLSTKSTHVTVYLFRDLNRDRSRLLWMTVGPKGQYSAKRRTCKSVCASVRMCVRASVRMCVRACVRADARTHHNQRKVLDKCQAPFETHSILFGASLGEPHSYVLTWLFVIRDRYININRASDRLALCPRRSNQNLAQIPYFDVAFLWLWLAMISSRKDAGSRALFFDSLPTASGVQLPF